jgi:outer membrane protein OmpA-like peptidoglycan-associated protein
VTRYSSCPPVASSDPGQDTSGESRYIARAARAARAIGGSIMRQFAFIKPSLLALVVACGENQAPSSSVSSEATAASGAEAPAAQGDSEAPAPAAEAANPNEFAVHMSETPKDASGAPVSKIKGTRTEAALKFIVVDKDKGAVRGVVIALSAPDGKKYYTDETNAEGYCEILVPIGQKYDLVYLSLARKEIAASVTVKDEPNQNIRLTLRYKRYDPPRETAAPAEPRFVLEGVTFASGKAVISPESYPRLDAVVEYMTYKKSARIEISGHTDNQGNPKTNKALSEKRAQACRSYLIEKGIDGGRIEAHGYGDERPIASNDSDEGRQMNRRIEATEIPAP